MYRSTTLELERKHCPRAMDHFSHGTEIDRDVFHVGTAAHAFLERLGNYARDIKENPTHETAEKLCDEYHRVLLANGRSFDGVAEPPMPADDVISGKELALAWHRKHGLSPDGFYEIGIGYDATPADGPWIPVSYLESKRARCIIDAVEVEEVETEEAFGRMLTVRDYKSSWVADDSELDTIQRKIQCLAAMDWAREHGIEYDGIQLQVANLRTRHLHTLTIWPEFPEVQEMLEQWRRDLSITLDALDRMVDGDGWRPARPGLKCVGCPYKGACEPGLKFLEAQALTEPEGHDLTRYFLVLDDERDRIGKAARAAVKGDPVIIDDRSVGYHGQESSRFRPGAEGELLQDWMGEQPELTDDAVIGLIKAMKLGLTQIKNIAKVLFDSKAEREDWLAAMTTQFTKPKFGVKRVEISLEQKLKDSLSENPPNG